MLREWVLSKLEPVRDHKRVLVRDPARLISEHDGGVLNKTCPHYIDAGLAFLGSPVAQVFCDLKQMASPGDVEDHVKVLLKGESGMVYDMDASAEWVMQERTMI